MKGVDYLAIKGQLIIDGYSHEIDWQTNLQPCDNEVTFANEAIWVILNSGFKEQIARMVWNSIQSAWDHGKPTSFAFKHVGKVAAIDYIKQNGTRLFDEYCVSMDKLEYLQSLPFIGKITKYHLAKNLGIDCVKPDRHLERIAKIHGSTPNGLCRKISNETGDKVSVVDIVLWRAANLGWI